MNKILIIEDDANINVMEQTLLKNNNYETQAAYSGTEALLLLERTEYDVILLDLMLPGMSGEEVLESIKKSYDTPVICVSAKDDIETKVELMRHGADDYIVKPFNNDELLVRIEALLRRVKRGNGSRGESDVLTYKDIAIDRTKHSVSVNGEEIELTNKEYAILELLMENPSKVFTKDNIYESVWQEDYLPEDNSVNVHVSNLRNKLAVVNKDMQYIKTVWGIGFKMN